MKNNSANPYDNKNRTSGDRTSNDPARDRLDITDPERDQERLQGDEATLDLPDVKDIPGQEFVQVPPLGMMADTTISSADEEGEGIFIDDEEDETDIEMGTRADITRFEKQTLQRTEDYLPTTDAEQLQKASLDNTDFEGEPLNERSFGEERTGSDLDLPTSDNLAQSDEENKLFSLGGDDNDENESRS